MPPPLLMGISLDQGAYHIGYLRYENVYGRTKRGCHDNSIQNTFPIRVGDALKHVP